MKIISLIFLLATVSACGPIYSTEYIYSPPEDAQARACIAQCNTAKTNCRSMADLKAENERLRCDLEAGSRYQHCLNRAGSDAGRAECIRQSCYTPADGEICDADFRICFQSCGGMIESRQTCSFNCP